MSFRKVGDIVLVVIVACCLLCMVSTKLADELGVKFPDWTGIGNHRSQLEGRNYTARPHLNLQNITSGAFQASSEKYLSDFTPMRDNILLTNAALQRACIKVANIPLGFECYPTYFGSQKLYIPQYNALTYLPEKTDDTVLGSLKDFGDALHSFAVSYPNKRFVLCVPLGYQDPAVNPSYSLVADAFLPEDKIAALAEGIGQIDNVVLSAVMYSSIEDYYQDFFLTDHHWNYQGVIRAYNIVAEQIELVPFTYQGKRYFEAYLFSGATARSGLDIVVETVSDTDFEFSDLRMTLSDGAEVMYGHTSFQYDQSTLTPHYDFYDSYYELATGTVLWGAGEGCAAVVSNSYGLSMVPYIACNYEKTWFGQLLHPRFNGSSFLQSIVDELAVDDIFLIANPTDLAKIWESNPDFLSVSPSLSNSV